LSQDELLINNNLIMEDQQQREVSFFRFEDLRVYHKSLEYFKWVAEQIKQANTTDQTMMLKQLANAAIEVSACIAEGSSRHKVQFITFLKDAKSAVRKCVVLSTMALQSGAFTQEQCDQSREFLVEMTKMLGSMVVSLQRNSRERTPEETKIEENQPINDEISFEY
jgi:S23 ribosomal protein.